MLVGQPVVAGAAVIACAVGLAAADVRGTDRARRLERFGAAVAGRIADGVVLGSVAWVAVSDRATLVAAAALTALGAAYLAAYLRAKAVGLGFRVDRLFPQDGLHFLLVGVGLLFGGTVLAGALCVAAVVSFLSVARDARQVGRQAEAR